jgi:hypothetical protein
MQASEISEVRVGNAGRSGHRRARALSCLGISLAMLAVLAFATRARAALPSNCSQAVLDVTCTYSYAGDEQTFTVPAGVSSIKVRAVGGAGGAGIQNEPGGPGGS